MCFLLNRRLQKCTRGVVSAPIATQEIQHAAVESSHPPLQTSPATVQPLSADVSSNANDTKTRGIQIPTAIPPEREAVEISLTTDDAVPITGRRVVDINYFVESLQKLNNHSKMIGCTFSDMSIIGELKRGYKSVFTFKCKMCNVECRVHSECSDGKIMDINTAAAAGSISAGLGHSQLAELTSSMNIPSMSCPTFIKCQDKVFSGFEETALEEMAKNVKEEAEIAVSRGEVDKHGVPVLTVIADGSWPKRSFGRNYSSLSGVVSSYFL